MIVIQGHRSKEPYPHEQIQNRVGNRIATPKWKHVCQVYTHSKTTKHQTGFPGSQGFSVFVEKKTNSAVFSSWGMKNITSIFVGFLCVCVLQMQQEVYNCVKIIRMSHVIHLQYRHVDATTASKGNRGDIFHPGLRAKHHRVGTVSLSLFFFFSFFSLFFPILELDLIFIPLFGSVHSSLNSFKTKVPPQKKDHWLSDWPRQQMETCVNFFFLFFLPA